jgi:hypothetical protein
VAGGSGNAASHDYGTVCGGAQNSASAAFAAVGGGHSNVASGWTSTIPGGFDNEASGAHSLAAGRQARANHDGAFVWADTTDEAFASERADQFRVRANGGTRFDVNNSHWIEFLYSQVRPGWYSVIGTSTGAYLTSGGTWTNSSDAGAKENMVPVEGQQVLDRLAALPVSTWNYAAEDPSVRHIGPTAQDFYAAFGYGGDETAISTIDGDGVALAAIQGLYALVQEKDRRLAEQAEQIADLETRLAALEALVMAEAGTAEGGQP